MNQIMNRIWSKIYFGDLEPNNRNKRIACVVVGSEIWQKYIEMILLTDDEETRHKILTDPKSEFCVYGVRIFETKTPVYNDSIIVCYEKRR